jgi:signal transduction histidine kinase
LRYSRRIGGPDPRSEPAPALNGDEIELSRSLDAAREARRFIELSFGGRASDRVVEDAKLLVTELANNAVVHGEGRVRLRTEVRDDAVRIEVIDEGTGNAPAIREEARDDDTAGRGLQIVDTLAERWGTFEGTTHVWADLPLTRGD